LFEAAKGMLVLAAGTGALSLVHRDVQDLADKIVRRFQLDPGHRLPHIFLKIAAGANDRVLLLLAGGALGYALLRFVEAYGLWYGRAWAQWLALVSGVIYLALEIYELLHRVSPVLLGLFTVNVAIVAYLGWVLWLRRVEV
jgi:uncharacterized membrane protein (DUF2068 family)